MTLPLIPALTGHSPAKMEAAEAATAVVVVLVLGYLAHQLYWLIFNDLNVHAWTRRDPLRVILDRYDTIHGPREALIYGPVRGSTLRRTLAGRPTRRYPA